MCACFIPDSVDSDSNLGPISNCRIAAKYGAGYGARAAVIRWEGIECQCYVVETDGGAVVHLFEKNRPTEFSFFISQPVGCFVGILIAQVLVAGVSVGFKGGGS